MIYKDYYSNTAQKAKQPVVQNSIFSSYRSDNIQLRPMRPPVKCIKGTIEWL